MTALDALQATLADEHAALYTYGVSARGLAGHLPGALRDADVRLPPPPRATRPAAAHGRATPAASRRRRAAYDPAGRCSSARVERPRRT